VKLRNQLLAVFCLLLFAAFSVFYVRLWVVQKPFGVIMIVCDGMVARQLTAARLYEGGAAHRLALQSFPHMALVANYAHDFAVPDAAAAATAMATGRKVNHRSLGMTTKGEALRNLCEIAKERGRSVGIVTTGELTEPGIAAFYAHHPDALETELIADQLLQARIDLAFGGGSALFKPAEQGGTRKDARDLLREITAHGHEILQSKGELENAPAFHNNRVFGLFASGPLAFSDDIVSGSEQPSLGDMVRRAIEFLQVNRKGYLLVIDAALAGHAADENAGERTLNETVTFDRALAIATKYAGDDSLIIAVGKHAIGGLTLNGFPAREDHGVALLGTNASGHPSLTWSTGPNGPGPGASPQANIEPAAFQTPSALETAEDVVAVGRGDGAEKLRGFIDNTRIFEIFRDAL